MSAITLVDLAKCRPLAITPYPRCGYLLPSRNSSQATLSLRYRPPLLGFWHEAD